MFGCVLECGLATRSHILKETQLSLSQEYQLTIVPWRAVRLCEIENLMMFKTYYLLSEFNNIH